MQYAIIEFGGKQHKVTAGAKINIEHQYKPEIKVLSFNDGAEMVFGAPYLSDIDVELERINDYLSDKVRVGRFKSKSRYRKLKGHRQPMSEFVVKSISAKSAKKQVVADTKNEVVKEEKKTTKKSSAGRAVKTNGA